MRSANGKEVAELTELVMELTGRVDELARSTGRAEGGGGNGVRNQQTNAVVREADDSADPIEFVTENGFSITRAWESGNSSRPADGRCRFGVSDGFIERQITVEISPGVIAEISQRTRGRIECSSSFWIVCAERHLANWVDEQGDFPDEDRLVIEDLNPEDVLLAIRWEKV